jgi:tetratricopeptide (TPR) repeat protein
MLAAMPVAPEQYASARPVELAGRFGDHPAMGFNRRKMEDERQQAAEKAAAARRATDAQVLEDAERLISAWNERQAKRMPMLFSPTIGAAIMDLYFQGMACANKGLAPEHMTQASSFFERALASDPGNIDALVGAASVDYMRATGFLADDRAALLAAAEASLTKALSLAPEHAVAHFWLGGLQIQTNRATQGIAECERALALDRNLARAHPMIGVGKLFIGRGEETEAHIKEALRLSPRALGGFSCDTARGGDPGQAFATAGALLTRTQSPVSAFPPGRR